MNIYGIVALLFAVILRLLPCVVTLSLCVDHIDISLLKDCRGRRRDLAVAVAGLLGNFAAFCLLHKLLQGRWNFLFTAGAILRLDITYQNLDYFPVSMLLCLAFSFILGMVLRRVGKTDRPVVSKWVKTILLSAVSGMGCVIILLFYVAFSGNQNIVINEVGSDNNATPVDSEGTVCDYIELYNRGDLPCEIYNFYLTDDASNLTKKAVPYIRLPAGGHLLIPLTDDTLAVRKEGEETITLSDGAGNILDQVTTEAVTANFAYCRVTDGASAWEEFSATPGSTNAGGAAKAALTLNFSHESGFYKDAFDLRITASAGSTVYYTLDGSDPGPESNLYTQPICVYNKSSEPNVFRSIQNVVENWQTYTPDPTPVDKAFIVRAVAVSENGVVGEPVSCVYFVGLEEYTSQNVISLIVDPEEMWGDEGIYVTGKAYDDWYLGGQEGKIPKLNYNQRGRDWEIEAAFSYFSQAQSFEQQIGLRIQGASARGATFKRFSLYSRNEYSGNRFFEKDLIDGVSSRRLVLRGGTANTVCQELVRDRAVAIQRSIPVTVFLNGEFWYETNLLEKYDDNYFAQHYGVEPENLIVWNSGELDEGVKRDDKFLEQVLAFLESHDMSTAESYAAFGQIVDMQSYLDYMCANIYIDNMDFDNVKNVIAWKVRTPAPGKYSDGKWRFAMYDLDAMEWNDAAFWGLSSQAEKNTFRLQPRWANAVYQQAIYAALIDNDCFRQAFVTTFMDMVNTNFAYENVEQVFLTCNGALPETYYADFFRDRAKYIVPYMAEEFKLTGSLETLSVGTNAPDGGYVKVNTITPELSDGSWTGRYYTDFPVTITAVAGEGYVFAGWEGLDGTEAELEVYLQKGGVQLNAIFQKINTP